MIELKNVCKTYNVYSGKIEALKNINITIDDQDFVMIIGHSGCGKSTLLNILAGFDLDYQGEYLFNKQAVNKMNEKQIVSFHQDEIGYVFQDSYLLNHLNIYENMYLPLFYKDNKFDKRKIDEQLKLVNLENVSKLYPYQLSGGQKQRVALARCLLMKVKTILLDEPTGSLDTDNTNEIMDVLKALNKRGYTIIMVTHDTKLINYANKVIRLENGYVV